MYCKPGTVNCLFEILEWNQLGSTCLASSALNHVPSPQTGEGQGEGETETGRAPLSLSLSPAGRENVFPTLHYAKQIRLVR